MKPVKKVENIENNGIVIGESFPSEQEEIREISAAGMLLLKERELISLFFSLPKGKGIC